MARLPGTQYVLWAIGGIAGGEPDGGLASPPGDITVNGCSYETYSTMPVDAGFSRRLPQAAGTGECAVFVALCLATQRVFVTDAQNISAVKTMNENSVHSRVRRRWIGHVKMP